VGAPVEIFKVRDTKVLMGKSRYGDPGSTRCIERLGSLVYLELMNAMVIGPWYTGSSRPIMYDIAELGVYRLAYHDRSSLELVITLDQGEPEHKRPPR
jgi:hypothetical protein